MNNNQNVGLLLVVILAGVLGYFVFTNNVSLKGLLNQQQQQRKDDCTSPFGPRASKAWESAWEAERTR